MPIHIRIEILAIGLQQARDVSGVLEFDSDHSHVGISQTTTASTRRVANVTDGSWRILRPLQIVRWLEIRSDA
jgi:hypothetical protein